MEYSIDAVANKMITVIVCLCLLIAGGSYLFFRSVEETIPFAIGIAMACVLNCAKVYLMKKAVINATTKEANAAQLHLQSTYFLRLILTVIILFAAGYFHANGGYINLFGVVIGLLTFHVASYSMRYFLREQIIDDVITSKDGGISSAEDAINEIKNLSSNTDENNNK